MKLSSRSLLNGTIRCFASSSTGNGGGVSVIERHVNMCLGQKMWILRNISQHDYCLQHGSPFNGSVGGHMRHSVDHFEKLMAGVLGDNMLKNSGSVICYDERDRNTGVEVDVAVAKDRVQKLHADIKLILSSSSNLSDHSLVVRFIGDCQTGESYNLKSNFPRELNFVCHHATHHLFFMKIMMEIMNYDIADTNIGVANSTILHNSNGK